MAWLSSFKLGRPGYELTFDANPMQMPIGEAQICAINRVLSGRLKKRVFRTTFPTIKISSNWFPLADRNKFLSLLSVTDTFLSFQVRDDLEMQGEVNYPTDSTHIPLRGNSATLLSKALVAAGFASQITVSGVYDNPSYTGTNYYTGGSYDDASLVVTLGSAVSASVAHYCTYIYKGWLVDIRRIDYTAYGGRVDLFSYDLELVGV